MNLNSIGKLFRGKTGKRRDNYSKGLYRRACFESLESRQLLSITLPAFSTQTISAGAPLNLALNGVDSDGNALTYTVAVSDANLTNSSIANPQLTTTVPTGNTSLRLTIDDTVDNIHGDMVFQLFNDLAPQTVAQITSLVNNHKYDGMIFHRVIKDFMIQGGDPSQDGSGSALTYKFDDEFNPALQFTGSGLLAMANSGADTNGSQFFVTVDPTRWLDFKHTIFGMITKGTDILTKIENVSTNSSDKPTNNVIITSASIITDNQSGVLRLSVPDGTTGSAFVTVTAKDNITGETALQTFQVNVGLDSTDNKPFLGTINPIQTNANTPVTFNIPATDVEGNQIYYDGVVNGTNASLTISVDHSTGQATVTPSNSIAGVYSITVGVRMPSPPSTDTAPYDTQAVPVYINPAAPTAISLQSISDTGSSNSDKITNLNNSSGKTLQFLVSGVISGADVELFADGVSIGHATATGTTVIITTNGTATLPDGVRAITAKQTLKNQEVKVGNLDTTVDLAGAISTAFNVTVETTAPQFNFIPVPNAVVGVPYTCTVLTNADASGGITYQLISPPQGMIINANTGVISWTPATGQAVSTPVVVQATDLAGNAAQQNFSINVLPANTAPVLTTAGPSLGATNEDTPITINLSGTFINNGLNTTTITDTDTNAVVGGIAVISVSGHGTWAYSLDGTTFTAITSVSPASAILLSKDAKLRYTPDGKNDETPLVSFRAWDTTGGVNGGRMDISLANAIGGSTAFSLNNDIATLTVNAVNDAPLITTAGPSLGSTTSITAKTINLSSTFINNGTGTTTITDVDNNDILGGIAIIGTNGTGTWEYSLDGTTYIACGAVSESTALLLDKTAFIRFTPSGTNSGSATITYRAWDTTSGTNGGTADLSVASSTGAATAFSTTTDTATLLINDAPVLTPISPSMGTTDEDTNITINLSGTFINNTSGTTTITDINQNNALGGIALVGITGNGTWAYSLNGTTFTTITSLSPSSALLLPNNASLRYTPDGKNGETPTITYRAWDATTGTNGARVDLSLATARGGTTAFSLATDTASLIVTSVNDAPVLTAANPSLGITAPSIVSTINLSGSFINNGAGTTIITDVDTNAVLGGIALVGATGAGTWEYSTDGTTYTAVGTVSNSSALLLSKEAKLRYTPNGSSAETPTITYRAWDTTFGQNGAKVDTTTNGGITPFSLTTDTASLTVATGSISGFVYIDADNDGLRIAPSGATHLALPGVVVKLFSKDAQGNWNEVSDKSPVLTAADGSYRFGDLIPGTYRVQEIQPTNYIDGKATAGLIGGTTKGTTSTNTIEVQVGVNENGTGYNFGERGFTPQMISKRLFLASTPSGSQIVALVNAPPTVVASISAPTTTYKTTYPTGGSSVNIVAQDAGISDPDSTMLASMTVSITNLLDGGLEILAATVANTPITSSYTNGVLTLSGVANRSVYETVLKTIKYSDTAQTPLAGYRNINIVASDGIAYSKAVITKVGVGSPAELSAIDQALQQGDNWLSQ